MWPKAWYDARIVEAEDGVDTKTWDEEKDQPMGQMVVLKVKVYRRNEGETETNSVMDWILYHHKNAQPQRIGRKKLQKLCDVCGITGKLDPDDLLGQKVRVSLKEDTYPDKQTGETHRPKPVSYTHLPLPTTPYV